MRKYYIESKILKEALEKYKEVEREPTHVLDGRLLRYMVKRLKNIRKILKDRGEDPPYPIWMEGLIEERDAHRIFSERYGIKSIFWNRGTLNFTITNNNGASFDYCLNKDFRELVQMKMTSLRGEKIVQAKEIYPQNLPSGARMFEVVVVRGFRYRCKTEKKFLAVRGKVFSLTKQLSNSMKRIDSNTANFVKRKLKNA